jgi:hypothetical protein
MTADNDDERSARETDDHEPTTHEADDRERSARETPVEADTAQPIGTRGADETTAPVPDVGVTAPSSYLPSVESDDAPRPRVRVGAIVWGVIVIAFAALVIAFSASPEARDAFERWQASLSPGAWLLLGVTALGVVVLLIAGVSAIRGAQRRAATRR